MHSFGCCCVLVSCPCSMCRPEFFSLQIVVLRCLVIINHHFLVFHLFQLFSVSDCTENSPASHCLLLFPVKPPPPPPPHRGWATTATILFRRYSGTASGFSLFCQLLIPVSWPFQKW